MIDQATLQADLDKAKLIGAASSAAASLVPVLIGQAQALFPKGTPGSQKLEFVKNWTAGALAAAGHDLPIIEEMWAKTEPIVATLVTIYTHSGVFAALLALTVKPQVPAVAG